MGLVIVLVIIWAYVYYDPYVDWTDDTIILWYKKGSDRSYKIIWSRSELQ